MENKPKCKIDKYGTKRWYLDGQFHRLHGPAIEYKNGSRFWYINNELHRENGPAVELTDGTKKWYLNGILHRLNGPAVVSHSGYEEWWINGSKLTDEIQSWAKQNNIDLNNITDIDILLIKITWADYDGK